MAVLSPQLITAAGITPTLVAASAGGDTCVLDDHTFIRIANAGASSITVTLSAVRPCNQGTFHDVLITVGAGATIDAGPYDPYFYMDATAGHASLSYSSVTSLTIGIIKL